MLWLKMEQIIDEDFLLKKEQCPGTFRAQGQRGGTYLLVVAIDELGAIVASGASKRKKAELDRFAYSDSAAVTP